MTINKSAVLNALSYVDDPDLGKDLVTLKMVDNIKIDGKKVSFRLILTTPACPMKDQIKNACITAIKHLVDKEAEVSVEITSKVTSHRQDNGKILPNVKNIILNITYCIGFLNSNVIRSLSPIARYFSRSTSLSLRLGGSVQTPSL